MLCYEGGINWTWYCDLTINDDKTVTIHHHYRLHNERDIHPKAVLSFRMTEDGNRNVIGIRIGTENYVVANQKHVFSYSGNDHD